MNQFFGLEHRTPSSSLYTPSFPWLVTLHTMVPSTLLCRFRFLLLSHLCLSFYYLGIANAQATTNATCLSDMGFLFNSRGQSPCLVMASLAGPCAGGPYNVDPLPPGYSYFLSGTYVSPCQCNTVFYSMMAACTACQGDRQYPKWSSWNENCTTIHESIYPLEIPASISVPAWAYANVTVLDTWNIEDARRNTAPDSTAPPRQTSTSTATTTPTITPSGTKNNTGAIVGGVVGGVVGLGLIVAILFVCLRRRKDNEIEKKREERIESMTQEFERTSVVNIDGNAGGMVRMPSPIQQQQQQHNLGNTFASSYSVQGISLPTTPITPGSISSNVPLLTGTSTQVQVHNLAAPGSPTMNYANTYPASINSGGGNVNGAYRGFAEVQQSRID